MTCKSYLQRVLPILMVSCLVGCCYKSDQVLVFEGRLFSDAEMQELTGNYRLDQLPSEIRDASLTIEQKGPNYFAVLRMVGQDGESETIRGCLIASHIPGVKSLKLGCLCLPWPSQHQTFLVSFPHLENGCSGKTDTNVFVLARRDGNVVHVWVLDLASSILRGMLSPIAGSDVFRAEEVKQFLIQYADTYTASTQPIMSFVRK